MGAEMIALLVAVIALCLCQLAADLAVIAGE
jgi:hypothetical protein